MDKMKAMNCPYRVLYRNPDIEFQPYPYFRSKDGCKDMYVVSPQHGRSFLMGKQGDSYIISKGNGLSYTSYSVLNTDDFSDHLWGVLFRDAAIRDFRIGMEVAKMGVHTNRMCCVIELQYDIKKDDNIIRPCLLQYMVDSPYRLSDFPYMTKAQVEQAVANWVGEEECRNKKKHIIAANVLVRNLYILHSNHVLHNAIHLQNYTWALELLDFELSRTDSFPYCDQEDEIIAGKLYKREVMQTYEIIYNIAAFLNEKICYNEIENIFDNYGFALNNFKIL